jgi:molybdate transport system substrate-binding protein
MFQKVSVMILTAFLLIMGNADSGSCEEITISAAMSLKNLFQEIGSHYEAAHKGETLIFNFASSGKLASQIQAGAPVDIFASASQKYMNDVEQKGAILSGTRTNFAVNSVVLIKPASSRIPIGSFQDILKKEVRKISIGNPESVPAGRYAKEILHFFKVWDGIREKLIFAENVRQVLDYVSRNEVDAGVVYATDADTQSKAVRIITTAPPESHEPIIYPIAVVKDTKHEQMAKSFIAFVISEQGDEILQKHGFGVVP